MVYSTVRVELIFALRPKLSGPAEPAVDFVIDGPANHRLPGLVCGAETGERDPLVLPPSSLESFGLKIAS